MIDERAQQLAQLRKAYEAGILEESTYNSLCAKVESEFGTTGSAAVEGSGAVAQGPGSTAAGERGVAVSGNVYGDVYTGPKPLDWADALKIYRRIVAQNTGKLPLRGVDVGASDPTASQEPIGLANVFVSLDTTSQVELTEPKERAATAVEAALADRETRPLGVLEAVVANRHVVVLGEPGGGKSTFLNHLAYCLSMQALEPNGQWLAHLPEWPVSEAEGLPVVVILRDFARQLPRKLPRAEPRHLWNFIVARLKAQNLESVVDPLADALDKGKAFVLLDGLDEVPTLAQRAFVRDAVTAFIKRYASCRFLVTCRVLAYQPPANSEAPDLRLPGLPSFELARLDSDKIDRFVTGWYEELARLRVVRIEDKDGLARQLVNVVRRPDLWRLAPNPLLLTVMALVHTHKGRLPDARALLYEETVDILLWRWEQVKVAGDESLPRVRQLLLDANRTEVDLKRALWKIAYEVHSQTGEGEEELADIGELKLEKSLAALKGGDRNWAEDLIKTMKLRAGLLLEREPEVFTFPHRTFQEYLAGAHLATLKGFSREARKLAELGPLWREAILLAVGRLVYSLGDTDKPLALVGELCPRKLQDDDASWRKAWLSGEVLLEIGTNRVTDGAFGRDLLERVQSRLVDLIREAKLAPRERAATGATLGRLGDPRFSTDAFSLPDEPLLGFVEIPEGKFVMGTTSEDVEALIDQIPFLDTVFKSEQPQHDVTLGRFYIARYPVTVAQFRAFVEASNYQPTQIESLEGVPNEPVVHVIWHDALAYCDWLTGALRDWEHTPETLGTLLREEGWCITLPSEAEWEKASRSTDGRTYPWGDDTNPEFANFRETRVGRKSAVGCYPGGKSPYGCEDMSGNVWEWTRSLDGAYPYPVDEASRREREDLSADAPRVWRGGSFGHFRSGVRCASRGGNGPGYGRQRWVSSGGVPIRL